MVFFQQGSKGRKTATAVRARLATFPDFPLVDGTFFDVSHDGPLGLRVAMTNQHS